MTHNIDKELEQLPRTRAEAREKGITLFFPGTECKRGHIAPHYTSSYCSECAKEKNSHRYHNNVAGTKERVSAYAKEYSSSNKAKQQRHDYVRREEVKSKRRAALKEQYQADPDYFKNRTYKSKYGITLQERNLLIATQDGKCPICTKTLDIDHPWRVHTDHDHQTGEVRGILCSRCNQLLACIEDLKWRESAERYLARKAASVLDSLRSSQ